MASFRLRVKPEGCGSEGLDLLLPQNASCYQCGRVGSQAGRRGLCTQTPATVGSFLEQILAHLWFVFILFRLLVIEFFPFALYGGSF